jgi:hypothetical protein
MLTLLAANKVEIDLFKAGQAGDTPLPFSDGATPQALFGTYIGHVLQAIMVIALLSVLIFLVWGGFEWITSGGEKSKLESARNKMTGAVIGLIVLASSLGIYLFIQRFTGVEVFSVESSNSSTTTSGTNILKKTN